MKEYSMRHNKMSSAEEKLNELQNEYFEILLGMKRDGTPTENQTDNFVYNWTRLKELQVMIQHNIRLVRESAIKNAKMALEEAFTPELKKKLADKLQHEIDELDEEEE